MIFHTSWMLFNLFGWVWKSLRKWNLITLVLTGASWGILGIWYGFGYCPCTDWHWQVLRKIGETNLPYSYVKYLLERLFGLDVSPQTADVMTGVGFGLALLISLVLNYRDRRRATSRPAP